MAVSRMVGWRYSSLSRSEGRPRARSAAPMRRRTGSCRPVRRSRRRAAGILLTDVTILLETVQGEGGLHTAPRRWLARIRELADTTGTLVIVDDIQAGCGRTGTFFSFEDTPELRPELVCLPKSLSGMGLPMAALLIRPETGRWTSGGHNGTFRGHNLAFVAGAAAWATGPTRCSPPTPPNCPMPSAAASRASPTHSRPGSPKPPTGCDEPCSTPASWPRPRVSATS
ncbi:hypothetical protein ABIE67_008970 [Streptomyces sp. V4I8]|uniref:aminotransferase class III-fold pyridoxal phosphate-dependent enzyme n=1 Tax=Streptomyces sp. V4I8 TaxID=3156469 RepID=UPI0035134CA4